MTIELTINDRPVTAHAGQCLVQAAAEAGIVIPTLCWHTDLTTVGSCRLCVVEVDGARGAVAACATAAEAGMIVRTETPRLIEERRAILELLLADYHAPDNVQTGLPESEFERWCRHYGATRPGWARSQPRFAVDSDPNPFVRVDFNRCILCTRCVRACEEVQGRFVWDVGERGRDARIIAGADTTMLDARCESCGACAAYCPTGALDDRPSFGSGPADRLVTTTCAYCGVGCQFDLNVRDDRVIRVTSNPRAPVNGMSLCVKGRYGYDFIHHPDRLVRPRVREYLLTGRPRPEDGSRGAWRDTDWDRALGLVAERFCAIRRESGPDALGFLSSAKCSNEENYLVQKLARQVFGTHNIDHCARLCHSSTVAGLAMSFGSGAMSNSMDDIAEQAQALFIIGSNTTEQHPVFGAMLRQAVLRRGVPLIVADPRKIDIAEFARLHLRHRPGTDVALLNGLMYLLIANGAADHAFIESRCEEFDPFCESIGRYDPLTVSRITGVPVADLERAAALMASHRPMAAIWAMGITQHTTGVLNVLSLANLQMLLGNMGVPGGGVNPLRGQNNVQGACDMGALPNVFPGYQAVTDAAVVATFEDAWALGEEGDGAGNGDASLGLSTHAGLTLTEIIEAAGSGQVRGLFVLGENPVLTDPDSNHVRRCLERTELLVLQEIFPSETSHYADVLLPGVSFAERDGTFTNTERRVQRFRQAVPPVGAARADWRIIAELARRALDTQRRHPQGPRAAWDHRAPAEIMCEIAALTPSYSGVAYERLDRGERLQWPVWGRDHAGTPILHVGRFVRGKGRFHAVDHLPPQELPDHDYPLLLTTGRVLYHWHGGEMTRRVQGLVDVFGESLLEIAPEDARRFGVEDLQPVVVSSRRGRMLARAVVTGRVSAGVVFGDFHFPGERNVNNLTIGALDPVAKIPEYKVCAVRVEAAPEENSRSTADPVSDAGQAAPAIGR